MTRISTLSWRCWLGVCSIAVAASASPPLPLSAQGAAPATTARSGLLLGLQWGTPRTVWIETVGDSLRISSGPGLIVPRKGGFWRVGIDAPTRDYPELRGRVLARQGRDSLLPDSAIASLEYAEQEAAAHRDAEAARADTLPPAPDTMPEGEILTNMRGERLDEGVCFARWVWAAPLGAWPATPDVHDCEETEEPGGDATFTFVGPEHVALYLEVTADVSFSFARGATLGTMDSLAARGIRSTNDTLGGGGEPPPTAAVKREIRRCDARWMTAVQGGVEEDGDSLFVHDFQGTYIGRGRGRWQYVRYYALTNYAGRGMEDHCELQTRLSRSITGWDSLTVPWEVVKKRIPNALDAYSSPRGDLLVVVTPKELMVHRASGVTIGRMLGRATWQAVMGAQTMDVRDPSVAVMAQWATGSGAARWGKELAAVLPVAVPVARR